MKLEIELVPEKCWYSNLRKVLTADEWKQIHDKVCDPFRTKFKCKICGSMPGWLEAHEKWEYDIENKIQKLVEINPLCTKCHKTKHWGLAQLRGELDIVVNQFLKVNKCTEQELHEHLIYTSKLFDLRNHVDKWKLDISYIKEIGFESLYNKYKDNIC